MSVKSALNAYLNSAKQLTGADTVSLYLEADSPRQFPMLFHVGEMPPLVELESEQRAADFYAAAARQHWDASADKPVFHFYPSLVEGGYLLCVDIQRARAVLDPASSLEQRKRNADSCAGINPDSSELLWLGLRYRQPTSPPVIEQYIKNPPALTGKPPESSAEWLFWTLILGGHMAWEAYRQSLLPLDSITHLPGRVEFQAYLGRELEKSVRNGQSLGLLLINPDEFGLVNHRLGQEVGDVALREVAERLAADLRQSDEVFRYGGAIFGVVMPGASRSAINTVAEKLRQTLTQNSYLEDAVHFSFSVGAALYEPTAIGSEEVAEPLVLLRRADQALNIAKLSGGARTVLWNPDGNEVDAGNLDRLSGIFTADTEKDYRNMLLLWETITVISSWSETEAIAREFVERIGASVKPRQVGLFVNRDGERAHLLAVSRSQPNNGDRITDDCRLSLSPEQEKLIGEAERQMRTQRLRQNQGNNEKESIAYAIPLLSRKDCLGVLYLDGLKDSLRLDTSDLVFLDALASQIGVLLDRAMLAARWKEEKVRESQRLREEVKELRKAKQLTHLVYRSSRMQAVVDILNKVAPTDVTVLITGESGTGKDKLAHTVHELSDRKDKLFITMDCGAIAHSLIDSELFGHVKGAYTGAQNASTGRIIKAEGGTLFLDEIGELPLDTQAKLLRLIQEKEITPVGGTQPIKVDVRIVAATNRDLAKEVAQGKFRGDLYYRLQVVAVTSPPLRERPADILPLANHFMEQFCADYGKSGLSFNAASEKVLLDYSWPGNVRELQNKVLQAVIMSEGSEIGWEELHLPVSVAQKSGDLDTPADSLLLPQQDLDPLAEAYDHHFMEMGVAPPEGVQGQDSMADSPWAALREVLRQQILAVQEYNSVPVPLGKWLADDLVLAANEETNNIARRASALLGMPETTFRRRLEKVKREYNAGLTVRNADWSVVPSILSRLIVSNKNIAGEQSLLEQARNLLLEEVTFHVSENAATGSALMGVTVLTYRRWIAAQYKEAV